MSSLRALQRTARPTTTAALRNMTLKPAFRRNAHFEGAMDNAFNRERAAVKEHAAATSGTTPHHPPTPPATNSPPVLTPFRP